MNEWKCEGVTLWKCKGVKEKGCKYEGVWIKQRMCWWRWVETFSSQKPGGDWPHSPLQKAFNLSARTICWVKPALEADSWVKGKVEKWAWLTGRQVFEMRYGLQLYHFHIQNLCSSSFIVFCKCLTTVWFDSAVNKLFRLTQAFNSSKD